MKINLSADSDKATRRKEIRNFKIHWAVYHQLFISKDAGAIAKGICITVLKLKKWRRVYPEVFENAHDFWLPKEDPLFAVNRSLLTAGKMWTAMIEKGYDLFPSEMPPDFCGLRNDEATDNTDNQIGLEALTPAWRFQFFVNNLTAGWRFNIWIHDVTATVFAIGMFIG